MKIDIIPSKIVKFLSIFTILLIIIHINILIIYFIVDDPKKFDFVRMFDFDMERNVPTLFSSIILMISALLFYLLSKIPHEIKQGNRWAWLGLSGVFAFLSFDESVKIHEKLGDFTENYVDATGILYYPWFISYGILVLILGAIYFRFFWRMERKVFFSFMLAAVIFLTGAIGFDILGAVEASAHSTNTILYSTFYTIEESLEMFGVIYLISILFKLLQGTELTVN